MTYDKECLVYKKIWHLLYKEIVEKPKEEILK